MQQRLIVLALAGVLALTAFVPAASSAPAADAHPVDRYIVGFFDAPGHHVGDSYDGHPVVAVDRDLRFIIVQTADAQGLEERAAHDPGVRYLEPDDPAYAVLGFVPNDALYGNAGHYGSKKIGAEAAWDRTLGSTAVKVAMIDSGLLKTHEEFADQARVLQGFDFVNNDNDPNDQGSTCGYHGTHTTGTSGATIDNGLGIAGLSQHTILPVKAFFPGGFGCGASTSGLVNALKYAGDQGAHISSNSWSSSASSTTINDAVQYAHNLGTTHVAAAGNGGCANCVNFPWKDKASISIVVSATTSSDTLAGFSSTGPEVDVAAPGDNILSSCGAATNSYCTYDGTSMATPHVSGTAALLKALNPSWGFADIDARLKATAVDLGTAGFDNQFGWGRINADAATNTGPPPTPQCADGADNDGDTLVDYPADPGCTDANDNDETDAPPPPPPDAVHTHNIDASRKGKTPSFKVWSHDSGESPESGVTVSVQVCKSGGSCATGAAATAADGSVTFKWQNAGAGTYTTCVTDMAKTGFTWDSAAGHASGGNCHTETV